MRPAIEGLEARVLCAAVSGAGVVWQPVQLDFTGPVSSETAISPNPFLDYRLQVTFANASTGATYDVPGYFDGDGAGGAAGSVWRVRFTPDAPGTWTYAVSFRAGAGVAVSLSPAAGSPAAFDGEAGAFAVAPVPAGAGGFAKAGRLEYVGGHYYKFRDGGYWIKAEANSPENFLGYAGFDATTAGPYGIHTYATHVADWRPGDPDWGGGKGKGIIGALNYLADTGVNSVYMLLMNVGGDGQDVWPFAGPIDRAGSPLNDDVHYDLSKLRQWETVFAHAQARGIQLHLVLNETEAANKNELDDATLGEERKLFYREMVARFAHHNAVQWNVSEEYDHTLDLTPAKVKQFAGYIQAVDPYDHPVTVMSRNDPAQAWTSFLGDPRFSATSFQFDSKPVRPIDIVPGTARYGRDVEEWRVRTSDAGRPLPIFLDEVRTTTAGNEALQRKEVLWDTYLSGGAGFGHFLGKTLDRSIDDFRQFDKSWRWMGYARRFVEQNLPFAEMKPADGLLSGETTSYGGGQVFAKPGQVYAIYLPKASTPGKLDLGGASGTFNVRWFNPRSGKFEGKTTTLSGNGKRTLPSAPSSTSDDWVILITRSGGSTPTPSPSNVLAVSAALVNADNGQVIPGLENLSGSVNVSLGALPPRVTIVASVVGSVGSVRFRYDGGTRVENIAPYALAGDDDGGALRPFAFAPGVHTLDLRAYSGRDLTGAAGATLSLSIVVTG